MSFCPSLVTLESLTWVISLPGPPLSEDSLIETLLNKRVNVAITTEDEAAVRNGRFELAWVCGVVVCWLNDIDIWSDTT